MKIILFLIVGILLIQNVFAQCEQCDAALRSDILKQSGSLYESSAFLSKISEQEYDQYKSTGGVGIGIPILEGIIKVSANYSDFQNKMKSFSQEIGESWQMSRIYNVFSVRTSPVSYEAWSKCMEACLVNSGISLIPTSENENVGIFKIKYIPGPNDPNQVRIHVSINTNGKNDNRTVILKKNGSDIITFNRSYIKGLSKSIITARITGSYSAKPLISDYGQLPPNKVLGIEYSYETQEQQEVPGPTIISCNNDMPNPIISNCYANNSSFDGWGKTCDGDFLGSFYKVSITAPAGFTFIKDILSDDIIFGGTGGAWNSINCGAHKQYSVLASNPTYKQIRVLVGSVETSIQLKLTAAKAVPVTVKTYPFQTDQNIALFAIDNNKFDHYSIRISLMNGNVITIDEHSPNVSKRVEGDKTIFTVPI